MFRTKYDLKIILLDLCTYLLNIEGLDKYFRIYSTQRYFIRRSGVANRPQQHGAVHGCVVGLGRNWAGIDEVGADSGIDEVIYVFCYILVLMK